MRRSSIRRGTLVVLAATLGLAVVGGASPTASDRPASGHLVVVPSSGQGSAALAASQATTIAAYDAFTLVEATGADVARLVAAGGELRDDMRTVRIGTKTSDPTRRPSLLGKSRGALASTGEGANGLAVVQYAGPLKDSWIAEVEKTGVTVVSYMAQNGQLVSGDDDALGALADLAGNAAFVRALTPYTAADKTLPGLDRTGTTEVIVSTVRGTNGDQARSAVEAVSAPTADDVAVAGVVHQHVRLDAGEIDELTALGGVVAIEPFVEPRLHDERASRIMDGALSSFAPTLGSGHLAFLNAKHLNQGTTLVDVADEGLDVGVLPPAGGHPDFFVSGNTSLATRLLYMHEASVDPDNRDCGGHGTAVASLIAGYQSGTGATREDAQGFNYGLGVNPFARLGSTKVFNCSGSFDVATSITALQDQAYAAGARISNNSWGASVGGAYNATAQEFDSLVRDASPAVTGNQAMVEVVSGGNSGPGANSTSSPGTAKNVITVGASENVRAIAATDGCGIPDAQANSARDIVGFSSRGPTDDGRMKPDVVAPGSHLAGAQPQTGASYNGSGACNPQFPAGSLLYTLNSSSSMATAVATGTVSILRSWYTRGPGHGAAPSPALLKALLVNTSADLAGGSDGAATLAHVPSQLQGWGRPNLATVVNGAKRRFVDQTNVFGASGKSKTQFFRIASKKQALRVTLVWTDAVGPTVGNSFVNDLDLEVTTGGVIYKGNVFANGRSVGGGVADPANNTESVYLPKGRTGTVRIRVVAKNIAGDGVPGNADTTDQDYALVISNVGAPAKKAPLLVDAGFKLTTKDHDGHLDPGDTFSIVQKLKNVGSKPSTSIAGRLSSSQAKTTTARATWKRIRPGKTGASKPFKGKIKASIRCGSNVRLTIKATSKDESLTFSPVLPTGLPGTSVTTLTSTDVPKAIPDSVATGVTSTLVVPGAGIVSDLDVEIGQITHTFDGDLTIDLTSPSGTTVRLFNRHGGGGDNLTNTVFDDSAATAISAGVAPFTGSFRPFQPLSAFDHSPLGGTWKLKVVDNAADDTGTLSGWSLDAKKYSCP